jgi:hypothetical protein
LKRNTSLALQTMTTEKTNEPRSKDIDERALEIIDKLTHDDVQAFFAAKNVSTQCPVCPANSWYLPNPVEEGLAHIPLTVGDKPSGGESLVLPSIPVVCQECGFIRFHAAGPVAEYIVGERDNGNR